VQSEIDIFQKDLKAAIKLAKETKGWTSYGSSEVYGKNDISGTGESGQLKRSQLTLKYRLTKIFNGIY
jgi:hypothetical protein